MILQQKRVPATKKLIMPLIINLVDAWMEQGLIFPEMTYTDLFHCVLPGYTMGQAHPAMIGEALRFIEQVHERSVLTCLPNLKLTSYKWDSDYAA